MECMSIFPFRADGSAASGLRDFIEYCKENKSVFARSDDLEMEYARNFMEYLNQKRNIPVRSACIFQCGDVYLEFAKKSTKQRFF